MHAKISIVDANPDNIRQFGLCGYKNPQKEGFPEKANWLIGQFPLGLGIKVLLSEQDGAQGMIEFTPAEQAWRPVNAPDCLFIHCLFVGFKKQYKGLGYASMMIQACIRHAQTLDKAGVAAVCRDGSFMADRRIFEKAGFYAVDQAQPDFLLLFHPLTENARKPVFRHQAMQDTLQKYGRGVFILRASQCPYTIKNVREMCERAQKEFSIVPQVVSIDSPLDAQACPSPFGTFCVVVDGVVLAHHPISATRFCNILRSKIPS